jgi:hypothetical protein
LYTVLIMSSGFFWSNACKYAMGKPLQRLLDTLCASCGLTVRQARPDAASAAALYFTCQILLCDAFADQIAFFCVGALAGGTMLHRWRRMDKEDRGRVWRLYGWFSALMMCGSCIGAVAWTARLMNLANGFKGIDRPRNTFQATSQLALSFSWYSAFLVTYAIEFLCLSAAKLMVLDRMSVFAAPEGSVMRTRWAAAGRTLMAAVVSGNAVGLAANAASAFHYQKAAKAYSTVSAYYADNRTDDGDEYQSLGQQEVQLAGSIGSVQRFCEVAVLLLIVVTFAVVGVLSARRVSSRLLLVDAASTAAMTGRALRLRLVGTTAFVFVAFLIRSVLSTMSAAAYEFRDLGQIVDKKCVGFGANQVCDESCNNAYTHVSFWMLYTPEFESTIVLVSSPVALLVALWGMTTESTLQLMKSNGREDLFRLKMREKMPIL